MNEVAERVPVRRVLGLAVPALGVLAAEPLYVLVDTAVIGHLGAVPLAGLALGGTLFTLVSSQLTFLSYGTTARTARLHGAGRRADAVSEGVQAKLLHMPQEARSRLQQTLERIINEGCDGLICILL